MLVKNNKETIMKFKSVAAALLAAVTCVSMAACGSGSDTNADGKVEITMWHNSTTGDGKAYWESAAKAFEKENPNVTIKIEAIQNEDMDGKLQTALQDPNSAPDIFMARGGQKLRDVVEAGQAMDLTDKISDTVKNQMATAEATGTIDGKIYSVQQSVLPGGIRTPGRPPTGGTGSHCANALLTPSTRPSPIRTSAISAGPVPVMMCRRCSTSMPSTMAS